MAHISDILNDRYLSLNITLGEVQRGAINCDLLYRSQTNNIEKPPSFLYDVIDKITKQKKEVFMKYAKSVTRFNTKNIPDIRFEDQQLSSFSGIIIFQKLFHALGLKERLRRCFSHIHSSSIFGLHNIALLLIIHILLGWKRLSDVQYYMDDPMVLRTLGLTRLPHVSVISRSLQNMDKKCVDKMMDQNRKMVVDRLHKECFATLTADFDGSVLSSKGHRTEGTAVGYNKQKKGARSYYPLFATIAQTGQVYRFLNRPGNVHDSNGAKEFILQVFEELRGEFPLSRLEARLDSAHFNDQTCFWMEDHGIAFTITVPFQRFSELKVFIENRIRWFKIDEEWSFFEVKWKPKKWDRSFRFLFYRHLVKKQKKGPIQLDLFEPFDWDYEYKVVATNKTVKEKSILLFHNGRGSQENIFGELKSDGPLDYIPTRRQMGNEIWMLSAVMAYNLSHEIQMRTLKQRIITTPKRACRFAFEKLKALRHRLIQRAGRLTEPKRYLTLTMSGNEAIANEIHSYLKAAS